MWIYGYGSIIWRPGFDFIERREGYVQGWKRRFWQGSTDHRGVPGAPGRVVTMLREEEAKTWGAAYRVEQVEWERIVARLDHREKGGYEQHSVHVHTPEHPEQRVEDALVYVATPANSEYLGPAPLEDMVAQIIRSQGPSGANLEYFQKLAKAMREMDVEDPHILELEEAMGE
ncbi:MAG: gamma-glutamylcyclotransferase [Myxococcota bacterium]